MDLINLFLVFLLIAFGALFFKFLPLVLEKFKVKAIIDDQLAKPQAFHTSPIPMIGGIGIFLSLLIIYFYFSIFENISYVIHLSFCGAFFLLGFVDDIKINFNPKIRLIMMSIFLVLLINYNNFYVEKTGIDFLDAWIKNSKIFSLIFICLCFIFIVNGSNLIDGYNGLLSIHSLIIIINLCVVNYFYENKELFIFLFYSALTLIVFLIFNFPKAKIFLGDSGAYLLGTFIAVSVIKTSAALPEVSPFYFCIILFYLFFEVFFSFFRKLIKEKKSPVYPDGKHLHMLLYKILLKKNKNKIISNYYVSIIINLIYCTLLLPAILMMEDGMFCKYYSLLFFATYVYLYKIAYEKVK
jgi:UDP-GlcNAc:undecaprenyl-phosphate/decaprenyl-phosphate GlcNAc-1-phosphate transferase